MGTVQRGNNIKLVKGSRPAANLQAPETVNQTQDLFTAVPAQASKLMPIDPKYVSHEIFLEDYEAYNKICTKYKNDLNTIANILNYSYQMNSMSYPLRGNKELVKNLVDEALLIAKKSAKKGTDYTVSIAGQRWNAVRELLARYEKFDVDSYINDCQSEFHKGVYLGGTEALSLPVNGRTVYAAKERNTTQFLNAFVEKIENAADFPNFKGDVTTKIGIGKTLARMFDKSRKADLVGTPLMKADYTFLYSTVMDGKNVFFSLNRNVQEYMMGKYRRNVEFRINSDDVKNINNVVASTKGVNVGFGNPGYNPNKYGKEDIYVSIISDGKLLGFTTGDVITEETASNYVYQQNNPYTKICEATLNLASIGKL